MAGLDSKFVRVASGDGEPHMPNTLEIFEPRKSSESAGRVRTRRSDLVPLLEQLAYNLRWSWDPPTRSLFQALAPGHLRKIHVCFITIILIFNQSTCLLLLALSISSASQRACSSASSFVSPYDMAFSKILFLKSTLPTYMPM